MPRFYKGLLVPLSQVSASRLGLGYKVSDSGSYFPLERKNSMSDDLVNIRIGLWHFHFTQEWKVKLTKNEYHKGYPEGRFAVYQFFN